MADVGKTCQKEARRGNNGGTRQSAAAGAGRRGHGLWAERLFCAGRKMGIFVARLIWFVGILGLRLVVGCHTLVVLPREMRVESAVIIFASANGKRAYGPGCKHAVRGGKGMRSNAKTKQLTVDFCPATIHQTMLCHAQKGVHSR